MNLRIKGKENFLDSILALLIFLSELERTESLVAFWQLECVHAPIYRASRIETRENRLSVESTDESNVYDVFFSFILVPLYERVFVECFDVGFVHASSSLFLLILWFFFFFSLSLSSEKHTRLVVFPNEISMRLFASSCARSVLSKWFAIFFCEQKTNASGSFDVNHSFDQTITWIVPRVSTPKFSSWFKKRFFDLDLSLISWLCRVEMSKYNFHL